MFSERSREKGKKIAEEHNTNSHWILTCDLESTAAYLEQSGHSHKFIFILI